jgi:DNA-binding response OmpR family regulator
MSCKHVLIVDDNQDILFFLEWGIKRMWPHYQVTAVGEGFAALQQLRQGSVDLMLVDYRLPDMTGLELAQTVRAISPETQIVMMSANKPADLDEKMAPLKLAGYVNKPFQVSEIQRFVIPCSAS